MNKRDQIPMVTKRKSAKMTGWIKFGITFFVIINKNSSMMWILILDVRRKVTINFSKSNDISDIIAEKVWFGLVLFFQFIINSDDDTDANARESC